jgi:hypothetical protein
MLFITGSGMFIDAGCPAVLLAKDFAEMSALATTR